MRIAIRQGVFIISLTLTVESFAYVRRAGSLQSKSANLLSKLVLHSCGAQVFDRNFGRPKKVIYTAGTFTTFTSAPEEIVPDPCCRITASASRELPCCRRPHRSR